MDWSKFDRAMTDPRMPVQAVPGNLEKKTPEQIADAYQSDLRLVPGVKRFVESQRVASPVR
jgi:hypothetical protein